MMEFCARPGYVVGGQPGFLAIGASALAISPSLSALAGLTGAANKAPYFTAANAAALFDLSPFGRTLVDDADAPAGRATLGLGSAAIQNIGTVGATVPLLNGVNSWSGTQYLTASGGAIEIAAASPQIDFRETDAGTDLKRSRITIDGNTIRWQLVNDAYSAATDVFVIGRSTHVAATVTFPSAVTLTVAGLASFGSTLSIASNNPILRLKDNDAAADEKAWRANVNGQFWEWQSGNDAENTWDTAWFMQRTAGIVTSIQFNKSTQFNGPFTATSSLDISSANPVINFFENDVGTDLKRSRFLTNGGVLAYQIGNDAASSYTSLVSFSRATNVSGTMTVHSVTTLSVAGTLQMSNNNAVKSRNAANSADIDIAKVNTSNRVEIAGEEIIPWTAWTPTITVQTGALESSTIVQARYRKSGKMVEGHLTVRLKNDGTGTGAGYVRLTTPVTPAYSSVAIGRGTFDGHALVVEVNTAGYLQVNRTNSDSPIKAPGGSPNIDTYVVISFAYEVAS